MGYPTDEDFAEAHGWLPNRPSFSEADRLRDVRSKAAKKGWRTKRLKKMGSKGK